MSLKLLSSRSLAMAGLAASLIAAAFLFGMTGARTVAAMVIFFLIPFYLLLGKLNIEADEKVFFAFFIGLGFFSAIVFYMGRIIPSFRASVAVAFVLLVLLPFVLKKLKK